MFVPGRIKMLKITDERFTPPKNFNLDDFMRDSFKVMLDADLAQLYGVSTKRLNEQVKRNRDRFPEDFMLQLSPGEKTEVVANCDHLSGLKFLTYATEERTSGVHVPGSLKMDNKDENIQG